ELKTTATALQAELTQLALRTDAVETRLGAVEAQMAAADVMLGRLSSTVATEGARLNIDESTLTTYGGAISSLSANQAMDASRLVALEAKTAAVSVDSTGQQLYFTGVNVHVRSG